ncbi:hypothetical protein IJM86_04275 [bacterium]|nr:hypothetical protein [bacterium]
MAFLEQQKIQAKAKTDVNFNTEKMLPISEIKEGILILKDGGLRSIIKVEGLNLDLKNFDEIQVILEQYKRFLNSLTFPIQILIRNTYLDLTNYLDYMRNNIEKITSVSLKNQGKDYLEFLEKIDSNQGLIYVKEFYIVIPFYGEQSKETDQIKKSWIEKFTNFLNTHDTIEEIVERYRIFLKNKKELKTRTAVLIDGLNSLKMQAEELNSAEVVSLLFRMYNPLLDSSQASYAGDEE